MMKKLSEIAKSMAESILVKNASPKAIPVALQFVHIAWNFADEDYMNEPGYMHGLQEMKELILPVRKQFVIQDCEKIIEKLIEHKKKYYSDDTRLIFSCKYEKGNVKVVWKE